MTREHKVALVKPYCWLDNRKVSSHHLRRDCENASSVNMFKIKLTIIWQGWARLNT